MSLQAKFAALLVSLALVVAIAIGAALWSFRVIDAEISRPATRAVEAMKRLGTLKAVIEQAAVATTGRPLRGGEPPAPPEPRARVAERLRSHLIALEQDEFSKSTARNLKARVGSLANALAGETDAVGLGSDIEATHDVIERLEGRIVDELEKQVASADQIRVRLYAVLGSAVLMTVLATLVGVLLVRRWVLMPVAELRVAAGRFAAGAFDYRVPVERFGGGRRDELVELGGEVNHMASMIGSMQEERIQRERLAAVGEMVRRLAHNIRNPLAGIRSLAELTRSDVPAGSDIAETQTRIIAAVDRFEAWLKDLLQATSPMSIHPEPCQVVPWLRAVVDSHEALARGKGIRIRTETGDAPPLATFDHRHLDHAVAAILSNAIQASPAGSEVTVAVARQDGQAWELAIRDQGPGVPWELRDRIFQPYFTTKRDGNGIGLAVAQQVVRAHGGEVVVEDASDGGDGLRGALFRVRLPMRDPNPDPAADE